MGYAVTVPNISYRLLSRWIGAIDSTTVRSTYDLGDIVLPSLLGILTNAYLEFHVNGVQNYSGAGSNREMYFRIEISPDNGATYYVAFDGTWDYNVPASSQVGQISFIDSQYDIKSYLVSGNTIKVRLTHEAQRDGLNLWGSYVSLWLYF